MTSLRSFSNCLTFCFLLCIIPTCGEGPSCCSLTMKQLQYIRNSHPTCKEDPFWEFIFSGNRCNACPYGMCRVHFKCICPIRFLEHTSQHQLCMWSHKRKWPNSVGTDDLDFKMCNKSLKKPQPTNKSCCALSKHELNDLRGWSDKCPSIRQKDVHFRTTIDKCGSCKLGLCRLNGRCVCADKFLANKKSHDACSVHFGVKWPESINKADKDQIGCNTVLYKQSKEHQFLLPSADDNVTDIEIGEGNIEIDPNPNRFTTMQIIGIGIGIVSGFVTIASGIIGFIRLYQRMQGNRVSDENNYHN